jgi:hypothetical protein
MTTENKATRPNFFLLLDLNPDAPWSDAVYEKALTSKRGRWGRDSTSGVGQSVLLAQKYLRLIPEIKRIMEDPKERTLEAVAARAALAEEKKKRQAEFEAQFAFLNAKTSIGQAELDKFIETFKDIFTAQQIRDRITVPIESEGASPSPPQLDPIMAKNIADRLAILHMASLYELLGPGSESSATLVLLSLADQKYIETAHRAHNEEDTAKKELAGYAKDVFKSEEMRKKYDETLRQESLNALLKRLDEIMSHTVEKEIHVGQVTLFLQDAQKAGWSREEALRRLREHARLHKWSMNVPTVDLRAEKIRCASCKELNDKGQNFCSFCNKPLFFDCPDCGEKVLCEYIACGKCGFPVGNHYYVKQLLEEIEAALKKGDLTEADKLVGEAERAWRPKKADTLAQRISEFRIRIDTEKQQSRQKQKEVSDLVTQKKFFAVRRLLRSSADVTFADQEMRRHTVEDTIAQAQALMKRAQAADVSIGERIDLCRQALLLCTDYQEARDLLTITPPPPPQNLRATIKGNIVNLSWDLVPLQGITYHIIRKNRTQPNNIKDGQKLNIVTERTYDDKTTEVGIPVYYAVYSECEKVLSQQGAFLARSVLLTQDVAHLVAKVSDHQVDLSWKLPPNVSSICIVRKEGKPPVSLQDGALLAELDSTQKRFLDRNVENEHIYHYAVYCQFKNQARNVITSHGVHVMASPETPPQVLNDIDIKEMKTSQGLELLISWKRPKKGNVVILKSSKPLTLHLGDVIEESELSQHGQRLEDRSESVKDSWTGSGIAYYTPVILVQKWAFIGATRRYTWVDNVGDLKSQNLGSAIRLHWLWPEQCEEVIVSFSPQDWPEPNDPLTTTRRVSRAAYDQFGYHDIKGTLNQDYYITVSAIIKYGDDAIPARELRITGRIISKVVFHYEIKSSTFFHKKHTLHITPRTSGTLPVLLLIGKRDRLPMNKFDGDLLYRIEPMIMNGEKVVVELPEKVLPPNTFGKLFLEDDDANEVVTIHQPDTQKLRLS